SQPLSQFKSGWQLCQFPISGGFVAQTLTITFSECPQEVVGERFLLDEIAVIANDTVSEFDTYKVAADALHCRSGPSTNQASLGLFAQDTMVTVVAKQTGWYLCAGIGSDGNMLFGWSSSGYLQQMSDAGLMGDLNGDGSISALDALQILQYAVGKREFTTQESNLADVNKDQAINASDALMVLKIAVHKM
ncbi:MAG: hypothetical protein IKM39_01145, partial [Clostridia bacterium]|nr:hypothetical protein [Clostridia bacterium]